MNYDSYVRTFLKKKPITYMCDEDSCYIKTIILIFKSYYVWY